MTSPNDKQTLLSWLAFCLSQKTYSKFRSKFTIRLPSEPKDKSLKFVILSVAKNPYFDFMDTSLRSVWQGFCHFEPFAKRRKIHALRCNSHFKFMDTSLTLSMTSNLVVFRYDKSKWQSKPCFCGSALAFATAKPPQNRRLCLPQRACALAVMRLDRHGFANKFLIRWNYNTIFHFCGRNLQIFSKKCYEKSQKRASKAENKGWGFCVFVKFFGALFGFGKFFWVCWIFWLCLECVEKFSWNLFIFFKFLGRF